MYINGQRGFVRRIGRVSIALVLLVATGAGAVFAAGQPEAENTALRNWIQALYTNNRPAATQAAATPTTTPEAAPATATA